MVQKSNKCKREQNMIKIDTNVGQITDRNLNVRQLKMEIYHLHPPGYLPY